MMRKFRMQTFPFLLRNKSGRTSPGFFLGFFVSVDKLQTHLFCLLVLKVVSEDSSCELQWSPGPWSPPYIPSATPNRNHNVIDTRWPRGAAWHASTRHAVLYLSSKMKLLKRCVWKKSPSYTCMLIIHAADSALTYSYGHSLMGFGKSIWREACGTLFSLCSGYGLSGWFCLYM